MFGSRIAQGVIGIGNLFTSLSFPPNVSFQSPACEAYSPDPPLRIYPSYFYPPCLSIAPRYCSFSMLLCFSSLLSPSPSPPSPSPSPSLSPSLPLSPSLSLSLPLSPSLSLSLPLSPSLSLSLPLSPSLSLSLPLLSPSPLSLSSLPLLSPSPLSLSLSLPLSFILPRDWGCLFSWDCC